MTSDNWGRGQLVVQRNKSHTHEIKSVRVWVVCDVSREVPVRHPVRDELERVNSDTQKGDKVWVIQAVPHHCQLVEVLRVSLALENKKFHVAINIPSLSSVGLPWSASVRILRGPLNR